MKFLLNGALTIGSLDGTKIEIKEAIVSDNIFIFGLTRNESKDLDGKGVQFALRNPKFQLLEIN
jgi:starch phosphorylase